MSWNTSSSNDQGDWSDFQSGQPPIGSSHGTILGHTSQPAGYNTGFAQFQQQQPPVGLNVPQYQSGPNLAQPLQMAQNPMQPHTNLGAYGTGFNPQIQHYGHTPQQPYQHNLYPQQQQMSQNMNPQLFAGQTNNPQMFHQHGPLPDQVPQAVSIGQTGQVPFQQQHIGKVPTPAPAAQQPVETPEERRRREEKEEQRRREAEITKRKLKSINVSKPVAGGDTPLSLESLIGFTPETIAKPKQKPPGSSTDSKKATVEEAPPSAAATVERVGQPVAAVIVPPKDTPPSAPTTSIPGVSIDQLLSDSLSNLDRTTKRPVTRTDFKNLSSKAASSSPGKVFSQSAKSRNWGVESMEIEGLFAQQAPPQLISTTDMQQGPSNNNDDSFGEFQSVPVVSSQQYLPYGGTANPQMFGHRTIPPSQSPQPVHTQTNMSFMMTRSSSASTTTEDKGTTLSQQQQMFGQMTVPPSQSPQLVHAQTNVPIMMTRPSAASATAKGTALPQWILNEAYQLPQVYTEVLLKTSSNDGSGLLDTATLFPILLSSGVDRSILRELWGVVNKTVPGRLTKKELFALLGLIGLVQGGSSSVTLSDLSQQSFPPSVTLTINPATHTATPPQGKAPPPNDTFGDFQGSIEAKPPTVERNGPINMSQDSVGKDLHSDIKFTNTATPTVSPLTGQSITSHDPYTALRTATPELAISQTVVPSDPYSAFRSLNDSASSGTPPLTSSFQPVTITTNNAALLSNTSSLDVTLNKPSSTSSVGWADFSGPTTSQTFVTGTADKSDLFGDFSSFSSIPPAMPDINVTMPTLVPSPIPPPHPSSDPLIPSNTSNPSTTIAQKSPISGKKYTAKTIEYFEVWRTCLVQCDKLLSSCVAVFCDESVDHKLLEEIASKKEADSRLLGIIEVYRFAKRIHFASRGPGKKHMTPERSHSLMQIMMSIKKSWNKLSRAIPDNKMSLLLDSLSSSTASCDEANPPQTCSICLLPTFISISPLVTIDGYSEQYSLSMDDSVGRLFHVQCMDFWSKALHRDLAVIP